ncbi:MAG: hypothetical protein WAO55_07675 [Candidatus Manganitrophaceae bacterium]
MIVGLPGTGIGGLFYIVNGLLMPLFELIQLLRGRSSAERWRCVAAQSAMAAAILAVLWATAWVLSRSLPEWVLVSLHLAAQQISNLLGMTPTLLTVGTLGGVILTVELLSLCERVFTKRR